MAGGKRAAAREELTDSAASGLLIGAAASARGRSISFENPLIQIDCLMAEAVRRGGAWIACRPGCCECCIGPFSISQTDAARLREGMARLDAATAQRVRERVANYIAAIHSYDEDGLPEGIDEVACPALDLATGTCDLYDSRPIPCRTFGPAVKTSDGAVAACELCFDGASEEQIAACGVEIDRDLLELDAPAATLVAFALLSL